ncbi:DUF1905 domain-containing protein [Nocardioides sp. KIGAM211]|uniref:DUF1905 domain-containing protein n=1 Tax=Nocardioides luti TaxID=2761101 RepID=A0A7X0V9W3_9ACTN|nr:DUF1905 domain-containing protein [Nocardioides luti]MBB6626715.1 DUF1905 domain-containing protein [Nocardioides luti]
MELEFDGEVWSWRGPAPYHFVSVPEDDVELIRATATAVSYGWGMIPVSVRLGRTEAMTSLWPKDGGYVVPLKDALRKPEGVEIGDHVTVRLTIDV